MVVSFIFNDAMCDDDDDDDDYDEADTTGADTAFLPSALPLPFPIGSALQQTGKYHMCTVASNLFPRQSLDTKK